MALETLAYVLMIFICPSHSSPFVNDLMFALISRKLEVVPTCTLITTFKCGCLVTLALVALQSGHTVYGLLFQISFTTI